MKAELDSHGGCFHIENEREKELFEEKKHATQDSSAVSQDE